MRVLFRAAAGPEIGFGHLVRCRSIAHALGVTPSVSIRGDRGTRMAAGQRGFDVKVGGVRLLKANDRPDVLVVDEPSSHHAARWVRRARSQRIPVATLHDLGIGYVDSDLAIDGSVEPEPGGKAGMLCGPLYSVLDPAIAVARARAASRRRGILIALGGGAHVHQWGNRLAVAILRRSPGAPIRIVEGFSAAATRSSDPRITWVSAPDGLADELARADVAVIGGGVTLYEAAALSTPAVALAVVDAQLRTIRGFARRGAAIDAGLATDATGIDRAADAAVALLHRPARAARIGKAAAHLVDGRGVFRVADAVLQLWQRVQGDSHAA